MNLEQQKAQLRAEFEKCGIAWGQPYDDFFEAARQMMERNEKLARQIERNNVAYLFMMAATLLNLANLCWNLVVR